MRRVNINQPEFNLTQEQPGYSWRAAELGPAIGAARMGATLYELPPGEASFPYHYEYGCEEWLLLVSGAATLRDPDGITLWWRVTWSASRRGRRAGTALSTTATCRPGW